MKPKAVPRLPDDVFRWKCQAILEGLTEGATLEETKAALWDFCWSEAHGVDDWSTLGHDVELMRKSMEMLEPYHAKEAAKRRAAHMKGNADGR